MPASALSAPEATGVLTLTSPTALPAPPAAHCPPAGAAASPAVSHVGVVMEGRTRGVTIGPGAAKVPVKVQCLQISVDDATAATTSAYPRERASLRLPPPSRSLSNAGCNRHWFLRPRASTARESSRPANLAASMGCSAFITGLLMRIGRAATGWDKIACGGGEWRSGGGCSVETR